MSDQPMCAFCKGPIAGEVERSASGRTYHGAQPGRGSCLSREASGAKRVPPGRKGRHGRGPKNSGERRRRRWPA